MNFKSLAIGSVLALGSIFGSIGAAEARPATCWVGSPTETASAQYCDHYLPSNGDHVVYLNGTRFAFEIFNDGSASISVDGARPVRGEWLYHSTGGIQVTNLASGYWFVFER